MSSENYTINTTWNNLPIDHHRPAELSFAKENESLILNIKAQYFNSPGRPEQAVGEDFDLWEYEGRNLVFKTLIDGFCL